MAHDKRTRIGIGDKTVVFAAIDLHLVLVEKVPKIAGGDAERRVESVGVVDREGRIRQMLSLRLCHCRQRAFGCQPAPYRGQFPEYGAVAIELRIAGRSYLRQPVSARERAVEAIER